MAKQIPKRGINLLMLLTNAGRKALTQLCEPEAGEKKKAHHFFQGTKKSLWPAICQNVNIQICIKFSDKEK